MDPNTTYRNRDWLYNKYWNEGLTVARIARLCGVGSLTIHRWLSRFKMTQRDLKRFRPIPTPQEA